MRAPRLTFSLIQRAISTLHIPPRLGQLITTQTDLPRPSSRRSSEIQQNHTCTPNNAGNRCPPSSRPRVWNSRSQRSETTTQQCRDICRQSFKAKPSSQWLVRPQYQPSPTLPKTPVAVGIRFRFIVHVAAGYSWSVRIFGMRRWMSIPRIEY